MQPAGFAWPYDVVTCVASIHHMPFSEALTCLRQHLASGGTLVVVGVYRPRSRSDYLIDAAAIPVNVAMAWVKNKDGRLAGVVSQAGLLCKEEFPQDGPGLIEQAGAARRDPKAVATRAGLITASEPSSWSWRAAPTPTGLL